MLFPRGAHLYRVLYRVLRAFRTVATPGRCFLTNSVQEPPELAMSGQNLRHTEGEYAVRSFKPRLKEGTYRRNYGVPSVGLRQSLTPFCHHEIPPEFRPPCCDLSRQRSFAPALHLHAQIVHVCKDCCLQIPWWQASKKARRFAGHRAISPYHPYGHDPLAGVQLGCRSLSKRRRPHWRAIEGHGSNDARIEPSAGGVWTP
ncbi:hypothetical protein PYW08_003974 [Mythimna loreyi]|uniref:Uncharacterized protein n=3 Tax=Mythimna loreyi TaxID=667449 RepID=A0ACC2QQ58_9NEOP|nr:hypothetical protein PYW08_006221 [Mythimna loreyi]KAJ8721792.1 hypothetical protein PYW08_004194 [Mythimna loreyi]KAJ8725791.1 hypothetical protein PYW08_003974 [Mythimna loreyi]